jgi:hypothetical protein
MLPILSPLGSTILRSESNLSNGTQVWEAHRSGSDPTPFRCVVEAYKLPAGVYSLVT